MVLVLAVLSVAAILGMAYLQSATVRRLGSANLPAATRAKYLAESGLQHAMYTLRADIGSMVASSAAAPLGPFEADASGATYTFYAEAVGGEIGVYLLRAEGTVGGVKQKCSVLVDVAPVPEKTIVHALIVDTGLSTPSDLTIHGTVYSRTSLWNYSVVNGDVSSSGNVWDLLSRIVGTKQSFVALQEVPTVAAAEYAQYTLFGVTYEWVQVVNMDVLGPTHALADDAAITGTNPGGIVKVVPPSGTLTLEDDLRFVGTLIVEGDVKIDGTKIDLFAVDGFPALVVTGKVEVNGGAQATIKGVVAVDGGIRPVPEAGPSTTVIHGAVVSDTVGYDSQLSGTHTLQYNVTRATIYDFSETAELPKLKVLRWDD